MTSIYLFSNINFNVALRIISFKQHNFYVSSVYHMIITKVFVKVQQEGESHLPEIAELAEILS